MDEYEPVPVEEINQWLAGFRSDLRDCVLKRRWLRAVGHLCQLGVNPENYAYPAGDDPTPLAIPDREYRERVAAILAEELSPEAFEAILRSAAQDVARARSEGHGAVWGIAEYGTAVVAWLRSLRSTIRGGTSSA